MSKVSSLSSRKFRQRKSLANSARFGAIGASLGSVHSAPPVAGMARTVMRTREASFAVPASDPLSAASTASAAITAFIEAPPDRRHRPRSPWSVPPAARRLRGSRSRPLPRWYWVRAHRRAAVLCPACRDAGARRSRPGPAKPPPPAPRRRRCGCGAPSRSPCPKRASAAPGRETDRFASAPGRRRPIRRGRRMRPCPPPPRAPRPAAPRAGPCARCTPCSNPRARPARRCPRRRARRRSRARAGEPIPRSGASSLALPLVLHLVREVLAQLALHLQARVEEAAHHRPLADAQGPGQLFIPQPFHLAQQQDRPVVLGEPGERLVDLRLELRVQRRAVRSRQRGRRRIHVRLDLGVALVEVHPLGPPPLARGIEAEVGRDSVRPGEERRV